MPETHQPIRRRNRWLPWLAGGLFATLVIAAVALAIASRQAEPFLKARIIEDLHRHFNARVELDSFHISLAHGLDADGGGLRIWPPAQVQGVAVPPAPSGQPLLRIGSFHFHSPLHYRLGQPIRISKVELRDVEIHLPPKSHFLHAASPNTGGNAPGVFNPSFEIDTLECANAKLVLETSKPGKLPLDFEIARFTLSKAASGGAMPFDAQLTNPRPTGLIHTTGSFGPWLISDPGQSPIQGNYIFSHADLASFKDIAGILSSTGHYQGTLRDLTVDGQTDTPDFRLTHFGNSLSLKTRFHALVDATNGDTTLDPVDATLGRSHFTARGPIVRVGPSDSAPGAPTYIGHDIALTIDVDHGRIEEFVRLASRSTTPLLTGNLTAKAALHIPPGPAQVHKRLQLKGNFDLRQVRFTSLKIQSAVQQLSLRGRGHPKDLKSADPQSIESAMQGNFQMATGTVTFPSLTYSVPGADIQLKGTYGVEGGTLDFTGRTQLQATVSQMVGGLLGALLKPADRVFKKDGAGASFPVRITGTREDPKFALEVEHLWIKKPPK